MKTARVTVYSFTHKELQEIVSKHIFDTLGVDVDEQRVAIPHPKGTPGGAWVSVTESEVKS